MPGVLLNDFSNSDQNILKVQSTLDKTFFGKIDTITLTEFDSSTVPAIAAGSVVANNGSLYQFASEEAISTTDPGTSSTVADGTVYVLLVPGTGTITSAFTATAPTWSDSKQGWYGTGDEAGYRYIGRCFKATTTYTDKYILDRQYVYIENLKIGQLDMYAIGDIELYEVLSTGTGDRTQVSADFNIKKPIYWYLKEYIQSGPDAGTNVIIPEWENYPLRILFPGTYRITVLRQAMGEISETSVYRLLTTGEYELLTAQNTGHGLFNSVGDSLKLMCTYAEGLSELILANIIE